MDNKFINANLKIKYYYVKNFVKSVNELVVLIGSPDLTTRLYFLLKRGKIVILHYIYKKEAL